MNIIIAGAGEVGTHLARMLCNERHDITVIDPDVEKLAIIESGYDLMTLKGSATSFGILREANIQHCDLYIAVAQSESLNITGAILAKKLGARKTISRITSSEYLLAHNKEHFTALGIDYLIYPERIASKEVIALLNKTSTTDFVDYAGGKMAVYVIKLDVNAPVISKSLLDMARLNVKDEFRVIAITRNGKTLMPGGAERFMLNDLVYIITSPSGIHDIMKYTGKADIPVKNLMILGGSRIGIRTAKDLEKRINIKLIEINRAKCNDINERVEKTLVINGDGRDIDLLKGAGISNMDAFLAVTGSAETNILACLSARKLGVKKVICEVENLDYVSFAENMGLDTIINKKLSAASRIFRFTMGDSVSSIKFMTGTDAEILEFIARPGSPVTRGPLKTINMPAGAIIGGAIRGKSCFITHGNSQIKPNDIVIVFSLQSAVYKLRRLFQ